MLLLEARSEAAYASRLSLSLKYRATSSVRASSTTDRLHGGMLRRDESNAKYSQFASRFEARFETLMLDTLFVRSIPRAVYQCSIV